MAIFFLFIYIQLNLQEGRLSVKYREFAVKSEISKYFIFSQEKPFGEKFSKITIKVSKGFSFSRKPPTSEMLPHVI